LGAGLAHHQAGRLAEAEVHYRQILAAVPDHADALHLLGLITYQAGRHETAIELIGRAIQQNGNNPSYYISCGLALQGLKRLDEAVASYDRALALKPDYAEALLNRGLALEELKHFYEALESHDRALALKPDYAEALNNRGNTLQALGRFAEALESYDRAIALKPELAEAHYNRGDTLRDLDRLSEAAASYHRALALKPDLPEVYFNRGDASRNLGRLDEAVANYDRALALKPDYAEALLNRGLALEELERFEEALESYDRALAISPDYVLALYNRGNALRQLKRFNEALDSYDRALAVRPDYAEALNNRGITLEVLKRFAAALESYDRALVVRPDFAEALNNRGNTLDQMEQFDEAVESYYRAIAVRPDLAEAHYNLGTALRFQGRLNEAIASFGRAAALRPNYGVVEWFNARQNICDWSGYREAEARAREAIKTEPSAAAPLLLLAVSSTHEEQHDCARRVAAKMAVHASDTLPCPQLRPGERIRLGYLSFDFRQHAGAVLIAPLIERHDRRRFEIVGYSYGPDDGSAMRARFIAAFDRFVDIGSMSHRQAAELIHADGVDVLVDLTGFQGHGRTDNLTHILAYRPAPIQVNYFGYPGTMGAEFIDYIIVDRFLVPMDQQPFYTERLVQLPNCYQPNDTTRRIAQPAPSRAECGLPEEGLVFCCFNTSYKITPALFDIWMRLLKAVPSSVLWLLERSAPVKDNLRREAIRRGVAGERLAFAPPAAMPEYLARLAVADLFLDTLPYNAHTTASDALWAGLPVLTCAGTTFAGRVAGSLLRAVGLDELVTTSLEEYEALALRLATQPDQLDGLRQKLARNRSTMPLFDIARFTQDIEAAYTRMWDTWAAGQAHAAFSLCPSIGTSRTREA
jgi:predicted O-linked N-acetylglucosamine transferase (SPINDLY family)